MDGIAHIYSVVSAPWVAWVMLALLLSAVLAEWAQPGVISQAFTSFFARTDRTYRESPANFQGQLLITLFRLGTVTMTFFLCFCPDGQASLTFFGLIFGGVIAVTLLKMLVNLLLDYTFQLSRRFGTSYEPYGDLMTLIAVVLYPALLLLIHFGTPLASQWVAGAAAGLFLVLWIYRSWRTYVSSAIAPVYLMVYIVTMEVLPLAGLAFLSGKTTTLI